MNSAAGPITACGTFSSDLCVSGSYDLIESISSSKNSILRGLGRAGGNTSSIPPRDVNSPGDSVTGAEVYPALTSRSLRSAGSITSPIDSSITEEVYLKGAAISLTTALIGAMTKVLRAVTVDRWPDPDSLDTMDDRWPDPLERSVL